MVLQVYTDGGVKKFGCTALGAWAWLIPQQNDLPKTYSGWGNKFLSSSNAMELRAGIEVIKFINEHLTQFNITGININTDSLYFCAGYNKNLDLWIQRGWKKIDGNLVSNIETWQEVLQLKRNPIPITLTWVRAHSDDEFNGKVDELVKKALIEGRKNM